MAWPSWQVKSLPQRSDVWGLRRGSWLLGHFTIWISFIPFGLDQTRTTGSNAKLLGKRTASRPQQLRTSGDSRDPELCGPPPQECLWEHRPSRQEGVGASRAGYRKKGLFLSWGESPKFLCRQIHPKKSASFCKLLLRRGIYGCCAGRLV